MKQVPWPSPVRLYTILFPLTPSPCLAFQTQMSIHIRFRAKQTPLISKYITCAVRVGKYQCYWPGTTCDPPESVESYIGVVIFFFWQRIVWGLIWYQTCIGTLTTSRQLDTDKRKGWFFKALFCWPFRRGLIYTNGTLMALWRHSIFIVQLILGQCREIPPRKW